MALQDIVNNYNNKKKGANSFLPTNEQDLDTQADVSPIAPEIKNEQTAQENREAESSNAMPTVKYPNKPESMSDGDYEHLMSVGFSPEAISNYTKPYDPSTNGNYLQRIFESSVPKPTAPDEKKMRGARIVSGIGDALGLISQMWSAGKGAYMKERDYNSSALAQTAAKEKELSNIYLQQQNKYNDGMYNARLKDFLKGLDDYNNGRKGIQGVLAAKQKLDQAGEQFKDKQRYAYDKLAQDKDKADQANQLARDRFGESVRHNKAMESQGWARVKDAQNRTSAYVKNISSGGKNGIQMMIPANPNDPSPTKNELGENVKVFTLTKDEVNSYARAAKADPAFFERHPHLVVSRPDRFTGAGKTSYAKDDEIAAAYAKEIYDNGFDETSVPSSMPMIDWSSLMNQGVPDWNQMLNGNTPETDEQDEWGQFEISGF